MTASDKSKKTKRQKAWSELVQAIVRPPKRYKHQRNGNHQAKIIKLRKSL